MSARCSIESWHEVFAIRGFRICARARKRDKYAPNSCTLQETHVADQKPGTHNTARFLVWHRFYLHIYEEALRNDCGYSGNLPYWDWTKDLQHIYNAPIWGSDDISFGTNGTGDTSPVPGELRGSCVTDGPFANMTLHYLGLKEQEHCFSRGFASEDLLHNLTSWLRPQIIEKLLLMPRYEDFNSYLEHYTHLAIPGIIQGDLVTFTSPNGTLYEHIHALDIAEIVS